MGHDGVVLTNLGEKMSDEEVDELLKAVDTSSGEINYTGISPPSCPLFPEKNGLLMVSRNRARADNSGELRVEA